jgi:hypothetical protein
MDHGGKRTGAGRKSTWRSGCPFTETKLIRVPIAIAQKVLDIAHRLDAGERIDLVTNLTDVIVVATEIVSVSEPEQKNLNSVSSNIELSKYGWIQPPGAKKEPCFLKGKSLCGKWTYKGSSQHNRPNDYSSCQDCWVKYGKIVEQSKTTNFAP